MGQACVGCCKVKPSEQIVYESGDLICLTCWRLNASPGDEPPMLYPDRIYAIQKRTRQGKAYAWGPWRVEWGFFHVGPHDKVRNHMLNYRPHTKNTERVAYRVALYTPAEGD